MELSKRTPDASKEAVDQASQCLKMRKDNTFSDEEIDSCLPSEAKKIKAGECEIMGLTEDFKVFIEALEPDKLSEMETTVGEIAKKLNNEYYGLTGDDASHMYIVGSVGRGTCIKGISGFRDILFDLPDEVFKRFDSYKTLKQTSLLQEIRRVLKELYPKTDISGDGQVVVIEFDKYTVELVPGFKQSIIALKYPDTNDGGELEIY